MNLNFYHTVSIQPDLEDVAAYLNTPLKKVICLSQFLQNKTSIEATQTKHKIEKIMNKHLPALVNSYCALGLEYRNNVIIKKDNTITYTSKDILLKNVGKLIEEIEILSKNIPMSFKDINLEDFINIKENDLQYEKEMEISTMHNQQDFKNDIFLNPVGYVNSSDNSRKSYKKTTLDRIKIFLSGKNGIFLLLCILMLIPLLGDFLLSDKKEETIRAAEISRNISTTMHDIKLGTFDNIYGGKTIIKEVSLKKPKDGLSIKMQNITDKGCQKIAKVI